MEEKFIDPEIPGNPEGSEDCIICLELCCDDDYLTFPMSKSTCKCKYHMHVKCFKEWKNECPMCKSIIKPIKINDFKGPSRYTNYNILYNIEIRSKKIQCVQIFMGTIICVIALSFFIYLFYIFNKTQ
jgi:hypothetical protein